MKQLHLIGFILISPYVFASASNSEKTLPNIIPTHRNTALEHAIECKQNCYEKLLDNPCAPYDNFLPHQVTQPLFEAQRTRKILERNSTRFKRPTQFAARCYLEYQIAFYEHAAIQSFNKYIRNISENSPLTMSQTPSTSNSAEYTHSKEEQDTILSSLYLTLPADAPKTQSIRRNQAQVRPYTHILRSKNQVTTQHKPALSRQQQNLQKELLQKLHPNSMQKKTPQQKSAEKEHLQIRAAQQSAQDKAQLIIRKMHAQQQEALKNQERDALTEARRLQQRERQAKIDAQMVEMKMKEQQKELQEAAILAEHAAIKENFIAAAKERQANHQQLIDELFIEFPEDADSRFILSKLLPVLKSIAETEHVSHPKLDEIISKCIIQQAQIKANIEHEIIEELASDEDEDVDPAVIIKSLIPEACSSWQNQFTRLNYSLEKPELIFLKKLYGQVLSTIMKDRCRRIQHNLKSN